MSPDAYSLREMDTKQYLRDVEGRLSQKGLRVRTRVASGRDDR